MRAFVRAYGRVFLCGWLTGDVIGWVVEICSARDILKQKGLFRLKRRGADGSHSNFCGKCVRVCLLFLVSLWIHAYLHVYVYVHHHSPWILTLPLHLASLTYCHRWGGYPADLRHGLPIQARDVNVQCDKHGSDKERHAREIFEIRKQGSQILCAMGRQGKHVWPEIALCHQLFPAGLSSDFAWSVHFFTHVVKTSAGECLPRKCYTSCIAFHREKVERERES